jgi:hypothetical protein
MGISFGDPSPPDFKDPLAFHIGMLIGFGVVLVAVIFADKLGTYLFHKGYAKPFYIKGHRIHHVWICLLVPGFYLFFSALILLGYVQMIWNDMYFRVASVLIVAGVCMAVDFVGDKMWPMIRQNVILHHEWVYTIIGFYVVTFVVNVII